MRQFERYNELDNLLESNSVDAQTRPDDQSTEAGLIREIGALSRKPGGKIQPAARCARSATYC
jgi:hypothetical protein